MTTTNTGAGTKPTSVLSQLRQLVPKRPLGPAETLQVAELQAARLRQLLSVASAAFPVEDIASLPRVRLRFEADMPASGLSFWDGHNWIILLDSTDHPLRQRFSLVHEYKHIVDHDNHHHLFGPEADARCPQAEKVADYFAGCVLMPKLLVKRYWGEGPRDVQTLAELFEVSPAAMRVRLDQLGLTEPRRRCRPAPDLGVRHWQRLSQPRYAR